MQSQWIEQSVTRIVLDNQAVITGPKVRTISELPDPVKRYLNKNLSSTTKKIHFARVRLKGEFQISERDSIWYPTVSTQYATIGIPGIVWNAKVRKNILLSIRILQRYWKGVGSSKSLALDTFILSKDEDNNERNTAQLLRYLAESVWYPNALTPSDHLRWTAVDKFTAIATLSDNGNSVSMTFYFTEDYDVSRVSSKRERFVDGGYKRAKWIMYFNNYQRYHGVRVPLEWEAEWDLPNGNWLYWKGRVVDIEYNKTQRFNKKINPGSYQ